MRWHDEAIPANRGDRYVYGELSIAGGCLRISYVDQVDREATRDGLLVVWPMGFGMRTSDGVVEVAGPDGRVVPARDKRFGYRARKYPAGWRRLTSGIGAVAKSGNAVARSGWWGTRSAP